MSEPPTRLPRGGRPSSARRSLRDRWPSGPGGGTGPRVYKLRLAAILAGLGGLAVVSTVFGMMMAVASELPALENRAEYRTARNSLLLDHKGKHVGVLTGRLNRILVNENQISPAMKKAIIAIEDKRFYANNGIDFRGIGRALIADLARRKAVQGASTISQQFVKNALAAQQKRTVFQKLREAALAYHLNRKWPKQKILSEYLNAVYFGNGAYGIESAARTYFGWNHGRKRGEAVGCGEPSFPTCASLLEPQEAALIAGVVASPSAWDPVYNPRASKQRRDIVLRNMHEQGHLNAFEYRNALATPLPTPDQIERPREVSEAPYFTTWVKQQLIERYGATQAFSGGLTIKTTLDLDLQREAKNAVDVISGVGPSAVVVAIDNQTGEVRAMAQSAEYDEVPFNLATQGQRQPGSAFKPFVLAQALREGISPYSTWESRRKQFDVPASKGQEKFVVNNYEDQYSGVTTLANATANSDNSVYAELGMKVGTGEIAQIAHEMGIRTPISTNPAITLGGLEQGVTPLDMAHAYQTLASGGRATGGTLGPKGEPRAPVGISEVTSPNGRLNANNRPLRHRVVSKKLASETTAMLEQVVCCGTGKSADTGSFAAGKTGTTENYGDAWFVGYNKRLTVAVWVGYPDRLQPMETEYGGRPVAGGTYPATIWRSFMLAEEGIHDRVEAEKAAREGREYDPEADEATDPVDGETPGAYSSGEGSSSDGGDGDSGGAGEGSGEGGSSDAGGDSSGSSGSGSSGQSSGGGGGGDSPSPSPPSSGGGGGDDGSGGGGDAAGGSAAPG